MRAGTLRHRIIIQRKVAGSPQQNAAGEPAVTWSNWLTVWASVDPVTGKEPFLTQEHLSVVSHKVRLRYRSGIEAAQRISFDGRYFDIKAVLNWNERNREVLLLVEQGANEG